MDAFTVAEDLLPGIRLTPGQLAQLRAINHEYYTRLFALSRSRAPEAQRLAEEGVSAPREPTPAERAELRAMLVREIRDMLTPEQRRASGLEA